MLSHIQGALTCSQILLAVSLILRLSRGIRHIGDHRTKALEDLSSPLETSFDGHATENWHGHRTCGGDPLLDRTTGGDRRRLGEFVVVRVLLGRISRAFRNFTGEVHGIAEGTGPLGRAATDGGLHLLLSHVVGGVQATDVVLVTDLADSLAEVAIDEVLVLGRAVVHRGARVFEVLLDLAIRCREPGVPGALLLFSFSLGVGELLSLSLRQPGLTGFFKVGNLTLVVSETRMVFVR